MIKPIVHLSDYNSEWENQFNNEKQRIIKVIGHDISGIEHIGSTSIKGLKAKPIIDIMVGVRHLSVVSTLVTPLKDIEFEYIPKPELTERRFFRKGGYGKGTCHLHFCEINRNEWIEKLLFRDYLREHPKVAKAYASLKIKLASNHKYDRPTYTKLKEPFIKEVIATARRKH